MIAHRTSQVVAYNKTGAASGLVPRFSMNLGFSCSYLGRNTLQRRHGPFVIVTALLVREITHIFYG